MLRFLSRRNRNHQQINSSDIKSQRIPTNKNLIQCRVILLDNSDISIELSVSSPISVCNSFLIGLKTYSLFVDTQKNKKTFFGKKIKRKEVEQQQQRFVKTYQDEK